MAYGKWQDGHLALGAQRRRRAAHQRQMAAASACGDGLSGDVAWHISNNNSANQQPAA